MTDKLTGLPDKVSELVSLSRAYLRQETLDPLRRLGKVAGLSLAAGLLFAVGAVLVSVALMRAVVGLLPELWSWAGYVGTAVALSAVAGLLVWTGRK